MQKRILVNDFICNATSAILKVKLTIFTAKINLDEKYILSTCVRWYKYLLFSTGG
jgi:hypothetical protein